MTASGRTQRIAVDLPASPAAAYEVIVGGGLLDDAGARLRPFMGDAPTFLVADARVAGHYAERFVAALGNDGPDVVRLLVEPGEASKDRAVLADLQDRALAAGAERDSCVISLGGGVAGDLGGFLAATLLRGVRWLQVPTSLLAMVDSAVGGKTGVDTPAGKNLVGAFWHPAVVLADVEVLATLPEVELSAGLAEVIKYGVIMQEQLFTDLEDGLLESCIARVPQALELVVSRCVALKGEVVADDEREAGRRQILNFGHTLAHGIESASAYTIRHGEAVAIGMVAASRLSAARFAATGDLVSRVEGLCARAHLPVALPAGLDPADVIRAARHDKKSRGGHLHCVLIEELGRTARDGEAWSFPLGEAELAAALT